MKNPTLTLFPLSLLLTLSTQTNTHPDQQNYQTNYQQTNYQSNYQQPPAFAEVNNLISGALKDRNNDRFTETYDHKIAYQFDSSTRKISVNIDKFSFHVDRDPYCYGTGFMYHIRAQSSDSFGRILMGSKLIVDLSSQPSQLVGEQLDNLGLQESQADNLGLHSDKFGNLNNLDNLDKTKKHSKTNNLEQVCYQLFHFTDKERVNLVCLILTQRGGGNETSWFEEVEGDWVEVESGRAIEVVRGLRPRKEVRPIGQRV